MAAKKKDDRPLRICDVCGVLDTAPRHTYATAPGTIPVQSDHIAAVYKARNLSEDEQRRIVAEIVDTSTQQRHMDCCRDAGCPDGSCNAIADAGGAGLKDAALVEFLVSGKVDEIGSRVTEISNAEEN